MSLPGDPKQDEEGNQDEPPQYRSTLAQVGLCLLANSAVLPSGMTLGFSGVALPYMLSPNPKLHLSTEQASTIASVAAGITPVGCLLSGPLLERLGRRAGLLAPSVPGLVGWLLIASSSSLHLLLAGRLLTGLALGLSSTPATVLVSELASPGLRGLLATGTSIAISLGIALVYTLGLIFKERWEMIGWVCAGLCLLSGLLIGWLLPESPVWKARATRPATSAPAPLSRLTYLASPQAYKPLLIMNTFFLFQQLSGIFVVIFYTVDVAVEAGVGGDPGVVAVVVGLTRLVFTVVAGLLSKVWGRRPCAILSGLGMTLSLFSLALSPSPSLLPLVSLLLFILTSTIGFLTLPWTMMGEVYPASIRGVASGMTTCFAYIVSTIALKAYPSMLELMGRHGVFYFYGSMAALGTLFVYLCLPETQGKTLEEIELQFLPKSKRPVPEEEVLYTPAVVTITPSKKL